MIFAIVGIAAAVLVALDALRNWRTGFAKTAFGTYSRAERPAGFRAVFGVKLAMSAVLLVLSLLLLARSPA